MLRLPVRLPHDGYDVLVGHELLDRLGPLLVGADLRPGPVAVVTNPTVARHWLPAAARSLAEAGWAPIVCEVPDGEPHKTLATVAALYDRFVDGGLDRGSPVVALGGGVVGDLAGFAAATFLRGVPFVQAPTTLLAMVDASVGGKTAVDLPQGKNLVGAFRQPALVVADPRTLATLPAAELRSGMAEVVKHGILDGGDLFAALERGDRLTPALLARAIAVKLAVVEEDPLERGRRATLNLGHTFGHAIERLAGYRVRHGEAVAIGLVMAARLGALLGRAEPALVDRIGALLGSIGLPTTWEGDPDALVAAMATDKKRRAGRLRFVVPEAIGRVAVVDDVPDALVRRAVIS